MQKDTTPNRLINESSPYLIQHAYNPVDWFPWGKDALDKAKREDKPIIVSIGYSACHWCHVMERECFEKSELAKLMNDSFVSIKVDREERPDIDQIYMDAVQAMGIQGGWPLNVFLTPDAKPFYGGTYFPPQHWAQILNNISSAFKNNRPALEESAQKFTEYLSLDYSDKYKLIPGEQKYTIADLHRVFSILSANFDTTLGGMNRAPKFPMPNIYLFLLRYYSITGNEEALRHVVLTLDEMAAGGIYDQIGGGFARYSVDEEWFAPHFEKMLYDNGQLLSLYSEAYVITKKERYKEVVYETIEFLERELMNPSGGFYSALDADSEGEEGKFYVWQKDELENILKEEAALFCDYYNIAEGGNWEHNYNILNTTQTDLEFASQNSLSETELREKVKSWKNLLLKERAKRIRPGLDDKILTSWNGLALKGLVDAFNAFHEQKILMLAEKNATFILSKLKNGEKLWHSFKDAKDGSDVGKASIEGYLEDYATVIEGLLSLYQATFKEEYLREADNLTRYAIDHFFDRKEELFYFTDSSSEKLIARKKELFDNVISSSNSIMATNLYFLGLIMDNAEYLEISTKMLGKVEKLVVSEPSYLANWASLYTYRAVPTLEIAIVGYQLFNYKKEFDQFLIPNKVVCGALKAGSLPLLEDREAVDDETTIYVCFNKTCKRPVNTVEEAFKQIRDIEVTEQ
jgi:uncharacterized protein YyaL (SSP411 family)